MEIKGIKVEADFGRHMLDVTNQDKPGFIGRFGAPSRARGSTSPPSISAARLQGGDAICLVSVDQPVTDDVLAMVRTLPLVMQATPLAF